jgi:hypothetical protein
VLIAAARERRPLTYGVLLRYFNRRLTPVIVAALCRDLGRVCTKVEARGGPDLASLVVRQADGLPGEGYFASLRREGHYAGPSTGAVALAFVRERQAHAYRFYAAPRKDEVSSCLMDEAPADGHAPRDGPVRGPGAG